MQPFKVFFIFFFIFFGPNSFAKRTAQYSEATDVFEIMDNLSRWHTDLTPIYRQAWEKKFPLTLEEKGLLSEYSDLRKKYYEASPISQGEGRDIFGKLPIGYDKFADAFYSSASVSEALQKLRKRGISPQEITFLNRFYKTFQKKISAFVKESTQFSVKLLELNKDWKNKGYDKTLSRLTPFVLGKAGKKVDFTFRPVWWPRNFPPLIDIKGPYLILRYNPIAHTDRWQLERIAQRSMMALLQAQSKNQRSNLTKVFEGLCKGRDVELQGALLTLFSTMLPRSYKERKKFDLYQKWSESNYVDLYSKLLFPLLKEEMKERGAFAGRFMSKSAEICRQLHRLAVVP